MKLKTVKILFFCQLLFVLSTGAFFVKAQENIVNSQNNAEINAASEGADSRVSPGEFLPISVKLTNFGSIKRIDVIVDYKILDSSNAEIYSESETVAVDTTASFVKRIQLPLTIKPGAYKMVSILTYPYQEEPAISQFNFNVEKKIGGIFVSDLIVYSIMNTLIIFLALFFIYFFSASKFKRRFVIHDYSNKPKDQIIYYEMLSDIISQMRLKIGDDALEIAKDIPNLEINDKNGFIINIKKDPAKIVASLIARYEKLSGKGISFNLRNK